MSKSKGAVPKIQKPTRKQKEEDEYFITSACLVGSMLPYIPLEEREYVHKWMKKLFTLNSSPYERIVRNDYVWFLLVQLENGMVTVPFIQDPPTGRIKPVTDVVEKKLYEEILQAANNRSSHYTDEINMPPREETSMAESVENARVRPSEFLDTQPKPKFGCIAHGACFSDQMNN